MVIKTKIVLHTRVFFCNKTLSLTGIEPMFSPWKGDVLTTRRKGHLKRRVVKIYLKKKVGILYPLFEYAKQEGVYPVSLVGIPSKHLSLIPLPARDKGRDAKYPLAETKKICIPSMESKEEGITASHTCLSACIPLPARDKGRDTKYPLAERKKILPSSHRKEPFAERKDNSW